MNICNKKFLFYLIISLILSTSLFSDIYSQKKILIAVQGSSQPSNLAMGDGKQLAQLLGHFNTEYDVIGVDDYNTGNINKYDITFYIGFYKTNPVPVNFSDDVIKTKKEVVWINTGFLEFSKKFNAKSIYGFEVLKIDTTSNYDYVKAYYNTFTKGEDNINLVEIDDLNNVNIIATAISSKLNKEVPYIIKSKNLTYIADSPFSYADLTDRYLFFADYLHEILNEIHEESHKAIVRIEDVTPLDDQGKIRDITDFLSERGIPFLIGVIPFYVDPIEGIRVSLSEKPDMADALRYAEINGGTIVMHGITHQYRDVTAADFEFWDAGLNISIKDENKEGLVRKIESGLEELSNNGLHPLLWETPHYTASNLFYKTISEFFSTAIEQRISMENPDYSQFFPYVIKKDIYGQKIYPENLGYIPMDNNPVNVKKAIDDIIKGAKANLAVRDGFASFFFHSFLDVKILEQLIDRIKKLGYTFYDLKEDNHNVKSKNQIILSGSQKCSIFINDQYLTEYYYDRDAKITKKIIQDKRQKGEINKSIVLEPGAFYKLELTEFLKKEPGIFESIIGNITNKYKEFFNIEENWNYPRTAIIWNHFARGDAYNDQASLAAVFESVNIPFDTIFVNQNIDLGNYNLLIVPYTSVDFLQPTDYNIITDFIRKGGNIITDTKNYLSEELGIDYSDTQIKVSSIHDNYYRNERISWNHNQLVNKFDTKNVDEIFCSDYNTDLPMIIGKKYGDGKFIYINSKFDPNSQLGYSQYPYLLEYVRKYFNLKPIVRKNNLEVYFDPGFRSKLSIEKLIKQWNKQGISIVHVAGWHQYPKYNYDYKTLIDLAHANGILVFAWLELPQVSQKFWFEHPDWREKNYVGQDVRPSWRYPIALTDTNCLKEVENEFSDFLNNYDWDGVNLAELYFEAGTGFDEPNLFTPMHLSAQKEVKEKYNIELTKIFDPNSKYYWKLNPSVKKNIIEYRVNKLNEVYKLLLNSFEKVAKHKNGFQIIVTAMDSYGSPVLREYIAEDMDKILELQKNYNFILQVEDPQALWSTNPTRYFEIGQTYKNIIPYPEKLMLDLNILKFRNENEITPFSTLIQTGTESFHLVRSASLSTDRLTIYSESSINPQDLYYMPYSLASKVRYKVNREGMQCSSPASFHLELPGSVLSITLNDNIIFPGRNNSYIIPSGTHIIKFNTSNNRFKPEEMQTKILSFNGNLLSVNYGNQDLSFEYESDTRVIISLNRMITSAHVDGKFYKINTMQGNDCFSVFLPPGRHNVDFVVGDAFSKGINLTSFWSTTGIALFGTFSVALLLVMYLSVKVLKNKYGLAKK